MPSPTPERNPVEKLSEEFLERHRRGERPSVEEYAARYPDLADEIRDLFPALVMMEELKPPTIDVTGAYDGARPGTGKSLERLGDFRILREVGRGGMGIVYEAEQESLGRRVALKVLPSQALLDPQQQKRFQREARAAARLHHTNIVPVYGVGEHDGLNYYVMQFIQGLGLDDVLVELKRLRRAKSGASLQAGSPLPPGPAPEGDSLSAAGMAEALVTGQFRLPVPPAAAGTPPDDGRPPVTGKSPTATYPSPPTLPTGERPPRVNSSSSVVLPGQSGASAVSESGRHYWQSVARIGIQVADALEYAHGQGIFHRDIKPSNLLLDTQGTVWVTDFGLAKASTDGDNLTHTGDIVGTLRYMAPERFQGQSDARGDVYSLGLTLYELLVQRPAFDETDRNKLIHQVTHQEPPQPRKVNRAVPRDLETIVLKAIDREPARRYQTAAALAADLQRYLDDKPIQARRVSARERLWRFCRRNPALAASAALAVGALVAVTILSVAFSVAQSRANDDLSRSSDNLSRAFANLSAEQKRTSEEQQRTQKALTRSEELAQSLAAEQEETRKALGRSQELAGNLTAEQKRTQEALAQTRLLATESATLVVERGQSLLDREPRLGGLRLARGLQLAPAEATDLQRVARTNLAALPRDLPVLRATFAQDQGDIGARFSPDAKTILSGGGRSFRLWDAATGRPIGEVMEHAGPVQAMSFSPDGRYALTASLDKTARLWDGSTGKPVGQPLLHPAAVLVVTFSPDGKTILTGCQDRKVRFWDPATQKLLGEPLDGGGPISHLLFSPDGRTFLSGGLQLPVLRLWETATRKPVGQPLVHPGAVYRVAFSPDGQTVVAGCADNRLRLWDVASGNLVGQPLEHPEAIGPVDFRPDGKAVVSGSASGIVRLWDVRTGKPLGEPMPHARTIMTVAFSPDGRTVLSASLDATVRLWDADTGRPIGEPLPHPAPVMGARFSPDGRSIVTAAGDKIIRVWEQPAGRMVQAPLRHLDSVHVLAVSPDGKTLVTGSGDNSTRRRGEAQLWDLATGKPIGAPLRHTNEVDTVAFSPDGKRVLTGSLDTTARLWDAATGQPLTPPLQHQSSVWFVDVSPDGRTLLSGGADGTARLWDADTGNPIGEPLRGSAISEPLTVNPGSDPLTGNPSAQALGHPSQFSSGIFSPDGKTVLTGGYDNAARLWDAATGKPIGTPMMHEARVRRVAFSPDGKLLLTGSFDKTARLWDAATGKLIGQPLPHQGNVAWVAFSPDGKLLLTAGDKTVRVWDAATRKPVGRPLQHQGAVSDVAISPDSRMVLTGCEDRTARLWDARTGQQVGPPLRHKEPVMAVAFTPDGTRLVTGGDDRTVRVWEAPAPLTGDAARLMRWVEVSSGVEVQNDGSMHLLDARTWRERRENLEKLGGPPGSAEPSGLGWHQRLAAENEESGHPFAARWHLNRLIDAQPGDWFARALRSRANWKLGRLDEAAADCARAIQLGPTEAVRDWLTRQSPDYDAEASWQMAAWYLDRLVAARPHDAVAHLARGRAQVELGQLDGATADFALALRLGPRDDVLARCRAYWEEYEIEERWLTGLWFLERLAEEQPLDWYVPARIGKANGRLAQFEPSLRGYSRALALHDTDPTLWRAGAVLYLHVGDVEGYRTACEQMLRHYTQTTTGQDYEVAWVCSIGPGAVTDWARPVQVAEKSVAISPKNSAYLTALGAVLYRAGRYEEALGRLDEAMKENTYGGSLSCWLFLALAHHRLGHAAEARSYLDKAAAWLDQSTPEKPRDARMGATPVLWSHWLEAQLLRCEAEAVIRGAPASNNPALRVAYGRAHVRLQEWDKAAADYSRVVELRPKDGAAWAERGRCYARLAQWDKAAADFTRAIELHPEDGSLWAERGRCQRELKQADKAAADYARAADLKSQSLGAKRADLERAPPVLQFREVLAASLADLAEAQRLAGRPADAAATLEQFRQLWPGHGDRLYEVARRLAACIPPTDPQAPKPTAAEEALRRRIADQVMEALSQAVLADYRDAAAIRKEAALAPLQSRDDFKALLAQMERTSSFPLPTGEVRRYTGHAETVMAVALSADGGRALSGGYDQTVRSWDVATGKELRRLTLSKPVYAVALSPDGRRALIASGEPDVRLWDVDSGDEVRRLVGHKLWVGVVRFLPDGCRAISAGSESDFRVWNLDTGQEMHRCTSNGGVIRDLAVSADGRRVLSGGEDGTLSLWDVDSGQEIRRFEGHHGTVWSVALSPDGRRALSGGADGFVCLWDLDSGRLIGRWAGHWKVIRGVAFLPDGRRALSVGNGGPFIFWDAETGRELHRFADSPEAVAVCSCPDGRHALVGHNYGSFRLWSLCAEAARARNHARLGQAEKAEADYEAAVQAQPKEPSLRVERGRWQASRGRWDAAVTEFSAALEAKADEIQVRRDRGLCYAELGRWDNAVTDFVRALSLAPEAGAPWWSGRNEAADELARRDDLFDRVAKERPKDRQLWAARARLHSGRGQWDKALADSARLLEIDPDLRQSSQVDAHSHRLAHACLQLLAGDREGYRRSCREEAERFGQAKEATSLHLVDRLCVLSPGALADVGQPVRLGEQALAGKLPDDLSWPAAVRYAIGAAHYRAGQFERAAHYCRESADSYPGWQGTFLNWPVLALAEHHQGRPQEARKWLDKTTAWVRDKTHGRAKDDLRPPAQADALNWLELQVLLKEAEAVLNAPHRREAEEAVRRQQWGQAVTFLDRLLAVDPGFWPDRRARAECLAHLERWAEAVPEFAKVHEQTPDDPLNWYYLAVAQLGAGNLDGYRRTCADMLNKFDKTENRTAASRVLYARVVVSDPDVDAEQLVRLAETAAPEWKGNVRILGAALYRAKKYDAAVQRFDEAGKEIVLRGWDQLFLAMAHHRLGHAGEAKQHLERAVTWIEAADRKETDPDVATRVTWVGWYERVEVRELRRQAEALLKGAGDKP